MITKTLSCCFLIGLVLGANYAVFASESNNKNVEQPSAATIGATEMTKDTTNIDKTTKEKRQIQSKDTSIYPNHRTDTVLDDPEIAQETIYGPKPNQFIIRAVSPHQHHQHEDHQDPQLRNYPTAASVSAATATQRSHNSQLLDQSQEIQHFAYLQDLSRNHPKVGSSSLQEKSRAALSKKGATTRAQLQYTKPEEAEQRYAVTIQAPLSQIQQQSRQYQSSSPQQYHHSQLDLDQHNQQAASQQPQQQQQYQIIPEEHFLKLIEQELQARAFHDEQIRQQQAAQAHNKLSAFTDRSGKGLSNYRQRLTPQAIPPQPPTPSAPIPAPTPTSSSEVQPTSASLAPTPAYVQYVPRHRGGPKYLPLSQTQQQYVEQQITEAQEPAPELPPQIAYYQPQISYKTLPNHPLAKSSLEKEIEKLLATNRPSASAVQILDNSNEPSAVVNHHYQPQSQTQPQPQLHPQPQSQHQHQRHSQLLSNRSPKSYISNTTPNSLLDANNQPFIPSLFRFSNYQTPTPIYPTQVPQHVIDAKKLGPVVYPTQTSTTVQPAQPSQYYYQEASPNSKPKHYRSKPYDVKLLQSSQLKQREKAIKISTEPKYAQALIYDFNSQTPQQSQQQTQSSQSEFYPSPPDPSHSEPVATPPSPTQPSTHHEPPPTDFRQYVLPAPAPSQSSIYVSQGTGITTPSRPSTHVKPKTIEDVKQLRLPQPGGKPLTQAEFQALLDAGYPVTAVPVPVPVPYEQYFKDHPEYRNQPPLDYTQIMRNAQQQYATRATSASRLTAASEPSVKIVSSPSEHQAATATAVGGGSITYLRPIQSAAATNTRRHPRNNEKDTEIAQGNTKEAKQEEN